jgi:predicted phage terminase large subunit-like protein
MIPFLTPADWDLAREVEGFSREYLVSRYDSPRAIPEAHREWWALCMSDFPQVAIAAPRGHAKSTGITFAYVLYILLDRRASHLLLLGSNEVLASAFLYDIKSELEENEALRRDFGVEDFQKETETELVVRMADGHKFRILVKGAGQRMRGIKWERKRPDHVVFDDMEDEEMVLNEQRREKFRRWFYGTVRPILAGGGKIRGVGTIIGFDSLLERMMPNEKSPDTVREPLRIYSKKPRGWASVKYRAHSEDFSEILWPEQKNAAELQKIRAEYAAMGMLDVYGQEYLNDPIDQGTAYFRPQDFIAMKPGDFETRKTYYAAADLAIGETERNAYTAMVVGGLDAEGFLNIVDVRRSRMDGEQIVNELFSVHRRWEPALFRTESESIEKAIGPFLYRRMDEEQCYIQIESASPTKDKDKRARSIQARMRAGKVRFDKDADWYAAFEEELLKYPKFPYKDQVDAFAWLGLILEEMIEPQTDKEIEDEEYQMAFDSQTDSGRNAVTGY